MLFHSVATLAKKLFYHSFKIFQTYLKFPSTKNLTASQFFKKIKGCLINFLQLIFFIIIAVLVYQEVFFSVPALFLQRHECILLSVDSKFSYFI